MKKFLVIPVCLFAIALMSQAADAMGAKVGEAGLFSGQTLRCSGVFQKPYFGDYYTIGYSIVIKNGRFLMRRDSLSGGQELARKDSITGAQAKGSKTYLTLKDGDYVVEITRSQASQQATLKLLPAPRSQFSDYSELPKSFVCQFSQK